MGKYSIFNLPGRMCTDYWGPECKHYKGTAKDKDKRRHKCRKTMMHTGQHECRYCGQAHKNTRPEA